MRCDPTPQVFICPDQELNMVQWIKANRGFVAFLMLFGLFRTAVADWNPHPSGFHASQSARERVVAGQPPGHNVKVPLTDVVLARTGETAPGRYGDFLAQDGTRLISGDRRAR